MALTLLSYPVLSRLLRQMEVQSGVLPQPVFAFITLVVVSGVYFLGKQRDLNEMRNFIAATFDEALPAGDELPKDALTGMLDRRALPEVLRRECAWADRYHGPLCLALADIRGFQGLNESPGHLAADLVLKDLAEALRRTVRRTDTVLRHGPDEFLCFLPGTRAESAGFFIRRLAGECARRPRLRGLTIDFGVAGYHTGMHPETVLGDAERNLTARRVSSETLPPVATQPSLFPPS